MINIGKIEILNPKKKIPAQVFRKAVGSGSRPASGECPTGQRAEGQRHQRHAVTENRRQGFTIHVIDQAGHYQRNNT